MKEKTATKRTAQIVLLITSIVLYGFMMAAKQIFSAELVEIIDVFNTTASKASLANLFYYITYAVMQVLLVLFIEKVNIKGYLTITMAFSAIATLLIGIVGNLGASIYHLFVIFAVNGILQAGCYAGLVRIYNKYLDKDLYYLGIKFFQTSQIASMILVYGLASIFVDVSIARWDLPFIIIGILFLIVVITFFAVLTIPAPKIQKQRGEIQKTIKNEIKDVKVVHSKKVSRNLFLHMSIICVIAFLYCAIYYAINNWFSNLLYNVYAVPKSYSILITVAVSSLALISGAVTITLFEHINRIYLFSAIAALIGSAFGIILVFVYNVNVILATACCIVQIVMVRAAGTLSSGATAYTLREVIAPSKYALLTNACASTAAGAAPTVISLVFENFGWAVSFLVMAILSIVLMALAILAKFTEKKLFRSLYENN